MASRGYLGRPGSLRPRAQRWPVKCDVSRSRRRMWAETDRNMPPLTL
ncbi:hypothetical protein ACFPM0_33550 [Pseudonocardia sulfidoxydans]